MHFHYSQDEIWDTLKGEFAVKVGEQLYQVKADNSVFGSIGIPHAFAKTNEGNAKLLMIFQLAGKMEEFFTASSERKLAIITLAEPDDFKKHTVLNESDPLSTIKKLP